MLGSPPRPHEIAAGGSLPQKNPKFYNAHEFVERNIPEPAFLVDPIMPLGGTFLLYGREGAGKTQLVMTLIRDLLNEAPFLDRYRTMRDAKAAYVSFDMPEQMVQDRVGRVLPQIEDPERFALVVRDGPIDIKRVKQNEPWVQALRGFEPDIILIDTLRKIHFGDENASHTVAEILYHLRRVFGRHAGIGLVHHEVKDSFFTKDRSDQDRQRGSVGWTADLDLGVRIHKFKNQISGSIVKVSFPRVRFSEEQAPIKTQMDVETLTLMPMDDDETALDVAERFVARHPNADRYDVVQRLKEEGYSKSQGYRAADEVL